MGQCQLEEGEQSLPRGQDQTGREEDGWGTEEEEEEVGKGPAQGSRAH